MNKWIAAKSYTRAQELTVQWILALTLCVSMLFLFTNLGHYALWDDETSAALGGESVLQTGDTKAMVGPNLIGYDNGLVINRMRIEGDPPFSAYLAAPFLWIFGENSLAARIPFALFGLATVVLLLWWVWKWRASPITTAVFALALLGNVSFFLYARQCRYYAPVMFFFTAIPYLYLHWKGDKRTLLLMGICSALLMSVNPTFYVLLGACLFADYLIWQRKVRPLKLAGWAVLLAPSLVMGLIMLAWWNPLHTMHGSRLGHGTFYQHLVLFTWHWRDMNRGEMIVGILFLFAPWIAFTMKEPWMRRGLTALVIFAVGLTALTIQNIPATFFSEVRYFSPVLLLCIALEVFTLKGIVEQTSEIAWTSIPLAAIVFGTNFFNGGLFFEEGMRSTLVPFIQELINPPGDPYSAAAKWIHENVSEGETIWAAPDYTALPLMYHAPKAVYAWQLMPPPQGQFANLPAIHFKGMVPPDYVIVFGPMILQVKSDLEKWNQASYRQEAYLNVFWMDLYRPELARRQFGAVRDFNPNVEGIYILKRVKPSAAGAPPPLPPASS
jgi:hypothetical protein